VGLALVLHKSMKYMRRTKERKQAFSWVFFGTSCSIHSYANVSLVRDGVGQALKINLPDKT